MPEKAKFGGAVSVSNGPMLPFDSVMDVDAFDYTTVLVASGASIAVPLEKNIRLLAILADSYPSSHPATFTFDTTSPPTCDLSEPVVLAGGALSLVGTPTKVTLSVPAAGTPTTVHVLIARTL